MIHIFDLDNTLVYTDAANRDAYNAALREAGLEPVRSSGRITRHVVKKAYPQLSDPQLRQIIARKQALFLPEKTVVNLPLLQYARRQGRDHCLIWSGADPARAAALIRCHGLDAYFRDTYFSKKADMAAEFRELLRRFSLKKEELTIYEDTDSSIEMLRGMNILVVDVKDWPSADGLAQKR